MLGSKTEQAVNDSLQFKLESSIDLQFSSEDYISEQNQNLFMWVIQSKFMNARQKDIYLEVKLCLDQDKFCLRLIWENYFILQCID